MPRRNKSLGQLVRFILNGGLATTIHFSVLFLTVTVLRWPSAGLSNLLAAAVGITVSYLGNRYFVFRSTDNPLGSEVSKFLLLYAALAAMQGLVLFLWSDLAHWDYRAGFVIATVIQAVAGYLGNRGLVFKPKTQEASP